LWLEWHSVRICDLLLGPPPDRAQLADHLDEAVGQLSVELAARWEVDTDLEALRTLTACVQDLVLDNADEPSNLAACLSVRVELLEGWVDATIANQIHWGTQLVLVAALSHFLKLEAKLELLRSTCNTILKEDQLDTLWILACPTSDSLALDILPSVTHSPPDGTREL
jgi:hypothetical protein